MTAAASTILEMGGNAGAAAGIGAGVAHALEGRRETSVGAELRGRWSADWGTQLSAQTLAAMRPVSKVTAIDVPDFSRMEEETSHGSASTEAVAESVGLPAPAFLQISGRREVETFAKVVSSRGAANDQIALRSVERSGSGGEKTAGPISSEEPTKFSAKPPLMREHPFNPSVTRRHTSVRPAIASDAKRSVSHPAQVFAESSAKVALAASSPTNSPDTFVVHGKESNSTVELPAQSYGSVQRKTLIVDPAVSSVFPVKSHAISGSFAAIAAILPVGISNAATQDVGTASKGSKSDATRFASYESEAVATQQHSPFSSVAAALVADLGIAETAFAGTGRGDFQPLAGNALQTEAQIPNGASVVRIAQGADHGTATSFGQTHMHREDVLAASRTSVVDRPDALNAPDPKVESPDEVPAPTLRVAPPQVSAEAGVSLHAATTLEWNRPSGIEYQTASVSSGRLPTASGRLLQAAVPSVMQTVRVPAGQESPLAGLPSAEKGASTEARSQSLYGTAPALISGAGIGETLATAQGSGSDGKTKLLSRTAATKQNFEVSPSRGAPVSVVESAGVTYLGGSVGVAIGQVLGVPTSPGASISQHTVEGRVVQSPFEAIDAPVSNSRASSTLSPNLLREDRGRTLAVGYQDPALGYVELRAHAEASGIHASLVAQSSDSGAALAGHLSSLADWMQERHTPVESLSVSLSAASHRGDADLSGQGDSSQGDAGKGASQSYDDPPDWRYASAPAPVQPGPSPGMLAVSATQARFVGNDWVGGSISVLA